jgi:DNA-binding transcriptional LysR family regulator
MDTFQALKVAAAVQRAGSFSAAARQLGVSPAAVAKLVAQLEARLGQRLFERTTHHLAVTEEGRDLLARLDAPLREVEEALTAGRAGGQTRGAVRVSVPATFARMALIPTLAAFQDSFPDIQLDIRLENRRVDLVAEGYDCAIGASLAPDSTLVARPLARLWPVLCASPAYLAARGEPRKVADLADHRCIVMRSDTTGRLRRWTLNGRGGAQDFEPTPALQLTDPESLAAAAVAGCGIALVGVHHVAQAMLDGRLVRVLKDQRGDPFQIVVYYARRRLLPQRTRAFVDHVLATVPLSATLRACQLAMDGQHAAGASCKTAASGRRPVEGASVP